MTQRTTNDIAEILTWIDSNRHEEAATEFDQDSNPTHISLSNFHDKLRIPIATWKLIQKMIHPNPRAFDTRMFALTRWGRRVLNDLKAG